MPNNDNTTESESLRTELSQVQHDTTAYKRESQRIGLVFTRINKFLRQVQQLAAFREPIVLLERRNGTIEFYEGVKRTHWSVPGREEGEDTEIHFNVPPKRFQYGKQWFTGYYCHEDYAFPIDLGYNVIKANVKDTTGKVLRKEFKVNLRAVNVNGEALRDLMRKVLVAWDKYKTTASTQKLKTWAKIILYAGGTVVVLLVLWWTIGRGNTEAVTAAAGAAKEVVADAGVVIRGG